MYSLASSLELTATLLSWPLERNLYITTTILIQKNENKNKTSKFLVFLGGSSCYILGVKSDENSDASGDSNSFVMQHGSM